MDTGATLPTRRTFACTVRSAMFRVLLAAIVMSLAGCASTSFGSPPGRALLDCDPAWQGVWDITHEEESVGVLVVKDDCRSAFFDLDAQDSDSLGEQWLQLSFVEHEGHRYVVATEEEVAARNEQEAGRNPNSARTGAYTLARYDLAPGAIAVHLVDTRAAARMIVDGLLWGEVSRREYSLQVFVRGTPEDTLRALSRPGLFEVDTTLQLKRSARGIDEFDAARPTEPSE